jgi:3D (Asp-Asp-Asp) domain-containing protein
VAAQRQLSITVTRADPSSVKRGFVGTAYGPPWGVSAAGVDQGGGITSTGVDLRQGQHAYIVATDPKVIPTGTKLRAWPNPFGDPSIIFTAADKGSAIQGNTIDFYDWRGRASQLAYGRQKNVSVQIIPSGAFGAAAAASASPGAFPGNFLSFAPSVEPQQINPALLQKLQALGSYVGQQLYIFSGYRPQTPGGPIGHPSHLAADVRVGGPSGPLIANAIPWQTIEAFGLRSGSDPGLQAGGGFLPSGGPDPEHVDLLNAAGTAPSPGLFYTNSSISQFAPGQIPQFVSPFGVVAPGPPPPNPFGYGSSTDTSGAADTTATDASKVDTAGLAASFKLMAMRGLEIFLGLLLVVIAMRGAANWLGLSLPRGVVPRLSGIPGMQSVLT